jgi:glycosyltransferase involved in cell wall biosynthesis
VRIWILTSELPWEVAGGIAGYVESFAWLLGEDGHEVVVLARSERPADEELGPGVRVVGFTSGDNGGKPSFPYDVLARLPALSHQIASETVALLERLPTPDVIESQDWGGLPYFLLQRKLTETAVLARVPVVVHIHGPAFALRPANGEPRFQLPEYWTGEMERFSLLAADGIVAPSGFAAEEAKRALRCPLAIETVPYPFSFAADGAVAEPEPGELVYVGRLQPLKGVLRLVAACDRLWEAGKDFRLTLIGGDTGYGGAGRTVGSFLCDTYARWVDSDRLRLTGRLGREDVLERIRRAHAVVIPSLWENFPVVGCEAMAAGQIVLASRSGGQAEQVGEDGRAGLLFDWNEPDSFERQVGRVLALTPEERESIGGAARARITALCDPEDVLRRRLEHFERVIEGFAPRRTFPSLSAAGNAPRLDRPVPTSAPDEVVVGEEDLAVMLERARGELVVLLGRDTTAEPVFVERALHVLASYENVDFVYPWVRAGTGERVLPTWNAELPYLLGRDLVSLPVVARRSAILDRLRALPPAPEGLELHDLWIGLVARGRAGVSLPEILACSSSSPDSSVRALTRDHALAVRELLCDRHPDVYARFGADLFGLENANGPALGWSSPGAASREEIDRESLPSDIRQALADAAELRYVKSSLGWRLLAPARAAKRALRG